MATSRPGDIFQPGDLLNNTYRVEAILGRGGTSEVYKARSEISGRVVALKALKSEFSMNDDYLALMTREEDMREVRHDAIVRYFDNQRMADGQVYLVMDYVDGPGLDKVMKSGPMPHDDVMRVAKCVAGGLVAAHEHNIVHRDLSPDNIILRNGDPSDAVIIDFGIAKDTNPGAETIVGNEFAGKYAYAAPEQLSGGTDARSDLYSLGALLLAALRGAKPDMGRNPMEVVQKKAEPLDVSGIAEPLASLIAKMSAPDPAQRFQTARALLGALMTGQTTDQSADDDATVVTMPPKRSARAKPAKAGGGGRRLWIPLVAVLVLGGAGAGAWFSGLLDGVFAPSLPLASPYQLVIEKPEADAPNATGNVPSDEVLAALAGLMGDQGGRADLRLARGEIAESWGADIMALTNSISRLPEYRIAIADNAVQVTGLTEDRALRDALESAALPGALTGSVQIELGPRLLPPDRVEPLLASFADCGALALVDPPLLGYGQTDTINIAGKLADVGSRAQLRDAIGAIAGDRTISIDAELLNPALCQVETALPDAPSGGIETQFGFGDRPDINPTGRYFVGENPVIDIVLPADVTDGFLWVSVLDVSGNVFHLLPNVNRPENDIATLRDGVPGPVPVRVAYSVAEGDSPARLAFLIDDTTLGKSKILVLSSDQDLFDGVRPTTESIASYTEALIAAQASGVQVRSLDSAILTTAQK